MKYILKEYYVTINDWKLGESILLDIGGHRQRIATVLKSI